MLCLGASVSSGHDIAIFLIDQKHMGRMAL